MTSQVNYSFEDAIAKTGYGKFNYFIIPLSGFIMGATILELTSMGMIIPLSQCELELSNTMKGLLVSTPYIAIVLFSNFWGFLADTRGRKKIMVWTLLVAVIFTVISSFSQSFWFLMLFRFLNGICISAPHSIIFAFLGEFHSNDKRAKVLMRASVFYGFTGVLNALSAIYLLNINTISFPISFLNMEYKSWRLFIIVEALPSLVTAILMHFFVPESPKFTYAQGDEETTLKILAKIHKWNTGRSDFQVKHLVKDEEFGSGNVARTCGFFKFMWRQTAPLFRKQHLRNVSTASFLQFVGCFVCNGFIAFLPEVWNKITLWIDRNPASSKATVCSILNSFEEQSIDGICFTRLELTPILNIMFMTGLFTAGWFAISFIIERCGKLVVINTLMFSSGLASIFLAFIDIPYVAFVLFMVLLMIGLNVTVIASSTVELFPTTLRAMAVSISLTIGRLGSAVGSNFIGFSLKNYCTYTWFVPAILAAIGGALAFTIPNISKRTK